MAIFYRSGAYVVDYVKKDGVFVSGHYRQGGPINFNDYCQTLDPYYNLPESPNAFRIFCLDCCEEVWFVRNTEYDRCFTADQYGPDWVMHPCWSKHIYGKPQKKMEQIVDYLTCETTRLRK